MNNWSDKKSPLWFIMLPTGHEGPYSLELLERRIAEKKLRPDVQVWREGLPVAISLQDVLNEIDAPEVVEEVEEEEDEIPPPLPPLPADDEELIIPEISLLDSYEDSRPAKKKSRVPFLFVGLVGMLLLFGAFRFLQDREDIVIRRYPKMSLEMHTKIQETLKFEGFDKKIFFREFSSPDLSHIWLVTSGYQRCDVEATFRSVKDRLLSMADEEVEMVSRGKLAGHVTELNIFEFRKGSKIIPGLYEMDVKAVRCEWDGIIPRLRNMLISPETEYSATTRVILYPRGPEEFQDVLSQLQKKKEELKSQTLNQTLVFWDELEMKFQTLHAYTLQIEQHFLDFIDKGDKNFKPRLNVMVTQYTKKFGQALTQIVIDNEAFFSGLASDPLMRPFIQKKDYEGIVRTASKQVGLESMTVIEKLQAMKTPNAKDLKTLRPQVLKSFEKLKSKINLLLADVIADRVKSQ